MNFNTFSRPLAFMSFISVLFVACNAQENSQQKTLFGTHNYRVLELSEIKSDLEKSVGALYITTRDDASQKSYTQKFCTALQIAPRFVISNAHCIKKKDADTYVDFFFSKDYIALDGEASSFIVEDLADEVYLRFKGKVKDDAAMNPELKPNLRLSYLAKDLDYAILEIIDPDFSKFYTSPVLAPALDQERSVQLLSYPNAMPLTLSFQCSLRPLDPLQLRHDCASAGGSSGAVLFDAETKQPLALHKQGVYFNSADFYKQHQRSENPVELAQLECQDKYNLEVDSELFKTCVETRSQNFLFNRAIPFHSIIESLRSKEPELFAKIFENG